MSRIEKKCVIASVVLHGLLVVVVVFGAAFQGKPAPIPYQRINVVPTRLVDAAMSGGGGNPNLPRNDDRVKGDTLTPQPPVSQPAPTPRPPEPQPRPTPPATVPTPRIETPKPPVRNDSVRRPVNVPKPNPVTKTPTPPTPLKPVLDLVPTVRGPDAKAAAKAAAEARQARDAAQKDANQRREFADKFAKASSGLKAGFASGTAVDVGGPGGEAYANYSSFVQAAYDSAWRVLPDLASQDHAATVEVVVARSGRIVNARILSRSGNSPMDKSVQAALDRVKQLPPFPEGARDAERTFTIEFNLKSRRHAG